MPGDLDRIRTDHTGALRRPEWLNDLYARLGEGDASPDEVREGQERAVREVIARQEVLGLPVVTDGEFCRIGGFQESFGGAVTGFDALPYVYRRRSAQAAASAGARPGEAPRRIETGLSGPGTAIYNRLPVKERLRLTRNLIAEEYRRASAIATVPVKVTLIGPDRISQRFEYENSRHVYADMDAFLEDVIAIEREMIAEAVAAGCRYIQIDEPGFTAYVDPPLLAQMRDRGEDPSDNLARSIRADNAVIAGFPGVTFGVHICRGNSGGRGGAGWHREGAYDDIAEALFGGLKFDRFLLEYDSEQAGSFEALRHLPSDKVAVLGLISNHGEVETAEYLHQRLEEAARYIPLDRVALCPRCGFGSAEEDVQWGKFAVMQQVARDVWG
ncbi:MAG TPA: cobalamin-independent methionine synthase II family protein [Dehalococcoidia bacterium]|nr:cobalamin-independent methionine synthase II family protein [Dehalococcoidia bacterium]